MTINIEDIQKMKDLINEEHAKLEAARSKICEYTSLGLIDVESYDKAKAYNDGEIAELKREFAVIAKYGHTLIPPVTGAMARKTPYKPEPLTEEEKALILKWYDAVYPHL